MVSKVALCSRKSSDITKGMLEISVLSYKPPTFTFQKAFFILFLSRRWVTPCGWQL